MLAQVLPALDQSQFSRLFGPADLRVFLAPDHPASDGSVIRSALRGANAPITPGMIMLSSVQIAEIVQARTKRSRRRIAGYLRKVAPEHAGLMSDRKLEAATSRWMEEASSYGIQSEAAHGRWCYMQLCADGKLTGRPEIRSAFSDTERTPDMVVSLMLKEIVREMRRAGF